MVVARSLKMIENSLRDALAPGERSDPVRSLGMSHAGGFEFLLFCGCVVNCSHVLAEVPASEGSLASLSGLVAALGGRGAFP